MWKVFYHPVSIDLRIFKNPFLIALFGNDIVTKYSLSSVILHINACFYKYFG